MTVLSHDPDSKLPPTGARVGPEDAVLTVGNGMTYSRAIHIRPIDLVAGRFTRAAVSVFRYEADVADPALAQDTMRGTIRAPYPHPALGDHAEKADCSLAELMPFLHRVFTAICRSHL